MSLELKSSLLKQAESKLKVEHGAVKGDVIPSPSPKKPASEFEKKLKNMPGDTSLVKDWTDCAFNNFCTFITLHFQKLLPQFYHIIWTYLISNFRICFTTYNCIPWRMGTSTAFIPCSVSSTLCVEKTGMVTRNSWKIGLMHMPPHVVSRRKCSSLHLAVFLWKKLIATSQCQKVQKGVDVCWPWQRHML